uniref:Uncharacterized protein n=1 Tax=Arundo donax TaxID=35708 RepID=A0A0A9A7L1_ARUDO
MKTEFLTKKRAIKCLTSKISTLFCIQSP